MVIEEGVRIQESGVRREIDWGERIPILFLANYRSWGIKPNWARRESEEKLFNY